MSGTRAPFVSLAALTAASFAPALGQTANPFDAAKRDLRSLPAAETNALNNDKSALDKSAIPSLTLTPAPASARPSEENAKTDAEIARSTNWLLDGVAKLENAADTARLKRDKDGERLARDQRDRSADANTRSATEASLAGRTPGAAPTAANPLGSFLTQWLSPRDATLLAQSDVGIRGQQLSREQRLEVEARALDPFAPGNGYQPNADLAPGTDALQPGRARNPYLESEERTATADPFKSFLADRANASGTASGFNGTTSPASLNGTALNSPSAPAFVPQAQAAPAATPTTRVVDDRKYFPQLRRF